LELIEYAWFGSELTVPWFSYRLSLKRIHRLHTLEVSVRRGREIKGIESLENLIGVELYVCITKL
jgi:hypothetical protein